MCWSDDFFFLFFFARLLFLLITFLLQKCMDDCEQGLTRLGEEMKAKVIHFITRLQECTRTHCDTNTPAIQKNISRICQDQARLQEVRCGIESLMQENDPFRFIGVRCVAQLCRAVFVFWPFKRKSRTLFITASHFVEFTKGP